MLEKDVGEADLQPPGSGPNLMRLHLPHPISVLTCLADPASKPALSPGSSSLGLPTRFLPRPRDGNVRVTCVSQQAIRPLNKIQMVRHKEKMQMATTPAALCRQREFIAAIFILLTF